MALDSAAAGDVEPLAGPVPASRLGIENMATTCVQGRGVMIDLHAAFGPRRRIIGYDDLARACAAQQMIVERGDMVCLHTGFTTALLRMGGDPDLEALSAIGAVLDSGDERLLRWVDESGLTTLIADDYAVEAIPGRECEDRRPFLPLHEVCC